MLENTLLFVFFFAPYSSESYVLEKSCGSDLGVLL